MSRTDTIGWHGELLVRAILRRDEMVHTVHNSMADADDPTVGISLFGQGVRIPLPDFTVSDPGGTLFTRNRAPKTYYVEVKTRTYFGYFKLWGCVTTGFDNWNLELYYRLAEEHDWKVKVWFVQCFNRCEALLESRKHGDAIAGIYEADIRELYECRPQSRFNDMAIWPVTNGPLRLIHPRSALESCGDTAPLVERLKKVALRDTTTPPEPSEWI